MSPPKLDTNFYNIPEDAHAFVKQQGKKMQIIREHVRTNALLAKVRMMAWVNSKSNPLHASVGDYVYLLKESSTIAHKLQK